MPNLVDYINSTNECRKAIINKLNNKLNSFIPDISIDTPLSEIDEKLNDININNRLINNTTYYVIRGYNQPGTNLINCIDPRLDNIETSVWNTGSWAKFRYIGKYPIKASAIVSFESSSTDKPYLKIEDKDGNIKTYIEAVNIYEFKFIDDIVLNQYDTVTMRTNGGNAWNAITSITLNSIIDEFIPILTLNNLNGSTDLTANNIELTKGKYRIIASSGAGSGIESEDTYNAEVWYKTATGGNGSNCVIDLTVYEPTLNISCICGKRGGVNNNQPFISGTRVGSGYSAGSMISGGNTIIKINNVNAINLSGGKHATLGRLNSSNPGEGGIVTINDTYKDYINVISLNNGNNGISNSSKTKGAYITAIANSSGVLTIDGNKYGYAGSVSTGRSGTNPTGGYISISKFKE